MHNRPLCVSVFICLFLSCCVWIYDKSLLLLKFSTKVIVKPLVILVDRLGFFLECVCCFCQNNKNNDLSKTSFPSAWTSKRGFPLPFVRWVTFKTCFFWEIFNRTVCKVKSAPQIKGILQACFKSCQSQGINVKTTACRDNSSGTATQLHLSINFCYIINIIHY